jgi:hypothetical protein
MLMVPKGAKRESRKEGWEAESFVLISLRITPLGPLNAEGVKRRGGLSRGEGGY